MGETVAIIDYGSGNLRSAAKAFEHAGAAQVAVTDDLDLIRRADRVVLPGVGAFGDCRAGLDAIPGMVDCLNDVVLRQGRPFLGICVGMQLLATVGEEHGTYSGLDWIPGRVTAIAPRDPALKIPHMGWNQLAVVREHPILDGIPSGAYAYFVHSYHLACDSAGDLMATVDYGMPLTAVVGRDTIVGTQFHPEKSQATGLRLIENFLNWKP